MPRRSRELKSGFEQDMFALRQRLHDALDRHSDSRAAADALRATGEALRVKLEASEASCLEKEQQRGPRWKPPRRTERRCATTRSERGRRRQTARRSGRSWRPPRRR